MTKPLFISIQHLGFTYETIVSGNQIISITQIFNDSGLRIDDLSLDDLPPVVRREVTRRLRGEEDDE